MKTFIEPEKRLDELAHAVIGAAIVVHRQLVKLTTKAQRTPRLLYLKKAELGFVCLALMASWRFDL
jgi:ABC-type cobalamin transport system permease subunit